MPCVQTRLAAIERPTRRISIFVATFERYRIYVGGRRFFLSAGLLSASKTSLCQQDFFFYRCYSYSHLERLWLCVCFRVT